MKHSPIGSAKQMWGDWSQPEWLRYYELDPGDVNGDLDMVAERRVQGKEEPGIVVWNENPGSIDKPSNNIEIDVRKPSIDRIEVAVVNGDKKADIIATEKIYSSLEPDAHIWWYQQESSTSWEHHNIVRQFSYNNLDITDYDKDWDFDILSAENKGTKKELQFWDNDEKGNFTKKILVTGKENHLGAKWTDLDNDGDLGIIGVGRDEHQYMQVWRNDSIKSLETGMRFQDYPWDPHMSKDSGKFLRVGGKLDYGHSEDSFPQNGHTDGFIPLNQNIDLENAIGAEVFVERVQCHEDTKDLKIQFNKGKALRLPEPATIPKPATDYMFHANIKVPVPLSELKSGNSNSFKLTVAKEQNWDWPQNLVYGVVLRIYYKNESPTQHIAQISGISEGDALGNTVNLTLKSNDLDNIAKVDYIGLYEDINVQGDGKYLQWQFNYHRGHIANNIGSSTSAPFSVVWNTSWLPDQDHPIQLTALATDKNGMIHVLPMVKDLHLDRNYSVTLIKPYGQQPKWTTRSGEHSEYLDIPFDLSKTDSVRLSWNGWSPCYSEGIIINNEKTIKVNSDMPCYDAYLVQETLTDMGSLKKGKNVLTTLKTPLHHGEMVHGMDVQWPGIMLKIKRNNPSNSAIAITEDNYMGRPHFAIRTPSVTYYYDIAGGGFSRILDAYGNDWVNFRKEPWDQYPASAASSFRGLPNLVFESDVDAGAGHPGHDKCESTRVGKNRIRTVTKSGKWEWEWTFHKDYAVLEILRTNEKSPYWFLYEGTPGGRYIPKDYSYGTNVSGLNTDLPDFYKGSIKYGNFQWAYFNKKGIEITFYVAQVRMDDHMDMMSYLGNTDKGVKSQDGMTVFGFGRGKNTEALMTDLNKFIIGIYPQAIKDKSDYNMLSQMISDKINKTNKH
ncbi:VCBS repeat-containing protein [Flavobacteriaceae bacterium F89]|uniref:VCBS repeat-containing protein n=1 Tax=Cerina litoralis TaxID=2874477 RepID=A0AAE3JQ15_9FLAO|nr:VCBS repeat-containing protein [Cerina litoralis]MCG2461626.1 VCBS repeat-containing protein [Cerina litoralis]